ncbi:MAG: hypothetical protein QOH06_148 [Acidobacteriota bacterium]|jgi:hypothetical protein|nr:hypothetical protein [Acidobacteriota bacterium]
MQRNELYGERIMKTRTAPALAGGLLAIFLAASAFAAPAPKAGVSLRDGVVIDTARSVAYVMHPQGGIQALDLQRGTALWHSAAGERPLALAGNLLVAQARPGDNGELRIVALGVRGGLLSSRADIQMPEGVRAEVAETLQQSFHVTAMPSQGGVLIAWETEEFSGLPTRREQQFGQVLEASAESRQGSPRGTALFDPQAGSLSAAKAGQIARPAVAMSLSAPGAAESRYTSADGRYVLASRLVDDAAALPYQWTISDAKGNVLGTLRAEASMAPFAVAGTRLIHVAQPSSRLEGEKMVDRPLRIRAVELTTGREVWRREILDMAWRGPVPN